LLNSDVIGVSMGDLSEAWLQTHQGLRTFMAAKRKPIYPLRTLLSDGQLRLHAAGLVTDLRAMFPDRSLALVIPAPGAWLSAANTLAHGTGEPPAVDDDAVESAAVYVADFLRAFAGCALDVLLLQESATARRVALDDPAYVPIANVAAHYRWDLGVRSHLPVAKDAHSGVSFVIAPPPITFPITAVSVPAGFWSGTSAPPMTGSFIFAEIPAGAEPERVLEGLDWLRGL
jgi:hypothetical protein